MHSIDIEKHHIKSEIPTWLQDTAASYILKKSLGQSPKNWIIDNFSLQKLQP